MPRTTVSDVQEIISTDLPDSSVSAWISVANELVDDIADERPGIDAGRLEKIERLAAAHLLSSQDQRIESASRETASVTYQGDTGMNFQGTKHGQAAIGLDPTGVLSGAGKPSASVVVDEVKDLPE